MKTFQAVLSAGTAALLLAGCGKDSTATKTVNTVSNLVDAPVNYLGAVVEAQKHAEKVIDVSYVNQDIQIFNASEGRFPKDLQEMIPTYLGKIPDVPYGYKIVYDATNGTVVVVKQ